VPVKTRIFCELQIRDRYIQFPHGRANARQDDVRYGLGHAVAIQRDLAGWPGRERDRTMKIRKTTAIGNM
jgi:hypothetical protein